MFPYQAKLSRRGLWKNCSNSSVSSTTGKSLKPSHGGNAVRECCFGQGNPQNAALVLNLHLQCFAKNAWSKKQKKLTYLISRPISSFLHNVHIILASRSWQFSFLWQCHLKAENDFCTCINIQLQAALSMGKAQEKRLILIDVRWKCCCKWKK